MKDNTTFDKKCILQLLLKLHNSGYLKPVQVADGNVFRIFTTAQLGNMTLILLPSQPQHQLVSCR